MGWQWFKKQKTSGLRFGELAKQLFTTTVAIASDSSRIDAVFKLPIQKKFVDVVEERLDLQSLNQ